MPLNAWLAKARRQIDSVGKVAEIAPRPSQPVHLLAQPRLPRNFLFPFSELNLSWTNDKTFAYQLAQIMNLDSRMSKTVDRLPPLNWLRSFEACARLGSFTAAAVELNIIQSAVSQQIKLLEAYLRDSLFFKSGRMMQLTEAGRDYVYFVREAFDMIRVGTRSVFDADRGGSLTLRSNMAFTLFWLMPRLSDLYDKYPWINLNILPHIWDNDDRPAKYSISIVNGIGYANQGYRPLGDEYFFPVCSPQILANGRVHEVPHFNSAGMTASWDLWHKSGHGNLKPRPVNYTSTVVVSLSAAANNVGLALSHTSLFSKMEQSGQLVRPFEGAVKMQEKYFISELPAKDQTPASETFLTWLNDMFIEQ